MSVGYRRRSGRKAETFISNRGANYRRCDHHATRLAGGELCQMTRRCQAPAASGGKGCYPPRAEGKD